MATSSAHWPLESYAASDAARVRAWRPFPGDVGDVLCVEEAAGGVRPRIHGRSAVTLIRSPAVVRVESSRSVVAGRNWVLLVPASQLYAVRALGGTGDGGAPHRAVTLLLGASLTEGRCAAERPALVADAELVAHVTALVAELRRPVHSVECPTTIRSVLERLAAGSTPVPVARSRPAVTPLAPVRDYLRARRDEQVTTAALARMSGLSEWHLIRAFHREFGLPPHAYHMRLRLAAACELLAGGLSVSTAAYECGFADQSHLSRKFKEVYGLTPAAWASAVGDAARRDRSGRSLIAGGAVAAVSRRRAAGDAVARSARRKPIRAPLVRRGEYHDHR